MSLNRRILRNFLILTILFFNLLFFQNCKLIDSIQVQTEELKKLQSFGNGDTYDGKLESFVRRVPGHLCGEKDQNYATAFIYPEFVEIYSAKGESCHELTQVRRSDIEFSPNTDWVFGYKEGIYISSRSEILETPETFAEAWCQHRDLETQKVLQDVVVRWTEGGNQAKGSVFSSTPEFIERNADLNRKLTSFEVHYNSKDFSLTINTVERSLFTDKFLGTFYYRNKESVMVQTTVECRLGGQFDRVAPQVNYPQQSVTLEVDKPIVNFSPISNKSPLGFTLDKALPEGVSLNELTGAVTGTPKTDLQRTTYIVKAKFKFGVVEVPIEIGIGRVYKVNSLSLEADADSKDNLCQTAAGACTLQAAIEQANASPQTPVVIMVPPGEIKLSETHLTLKGDLKIVAEKSRSTTLNADFKSRHFFLERGAYLEIDGLRLINGKPNASGGAILAQGAKIIIKDSEISNNFTNDDYSQGGALSISMGGTLEIYGSDLRNNKTARDGGDLSGGAIYAKELDRIVIKNSRFSENDSIRGGAIYFRQVKESLIEGTFFSGNTSLYGAALSINLGRSFVSSSTFENNIARLEGGAISHNLSYELIVKNSKFIQNRAQRGGALHSTGWDLSKVLLDELIIIDQGLPESYQRLYPNLKSIAIYNRYWDVFIRNSVIRNAKSGQNCSTTFVGEFYGEGARSVGGNTFDDLSCNPTSQDTIVPIGP